LTSHLPKEGLVSIFVAGSVPPELWNKLGTRLIPKLRMGRVVDLQVQATIEIEPVEMEHLREEIRRVLAELEIESQWRVEEGESKSG